MSTSELKSPDSLSLLRPRPNFVSALLIAGLLCLICAAATPFTYYRFDVAHSWRTWSEASLGTSPWRIYSHTPDCDYPPVELYFLTIAEWMRLHAHAPPLGKIALMLFKLPGIIALLAGSAACYYCTVRRFGQRYAGGIAILFGLSVPLWFDSAVWGQVDAVLCLGLLLTMIALITDHPAWCGDRARLYSGI